MPMMKYPAHAQLVKDAMDKSGCKTREEFITFLHRAISLRTLDRWLAGAGPLEGTARLVMRNIVLGWKPKP